MSGSYRPQAWTIRDEFRHGIASFTVLNPLDNPVAVFPTKVLAEQYVAAQSKSPDAVDHPPHYTFGGIEVIDAIEAWGLGFHLGNAVKYIARARHKGNELEDLKKSRWYLERAIKNLEKTQ